MMINRLLDYVMTSSFDPAVLFLIGVSGFLTLLYSVLGLIARRRPLFVNWSNTGTQKNQSQTLRMKRGSSFNIVDEDERTLIVLKWFGGNVIGLDTFSYPAEKPKKVPLKIVGRRRR